MNASPLLRFQHILQSIDHILIFIKQDPKISELRIAQVIFYELVVIGEAPKHIPVSYQQEFSDVPWRKIIALRNILTHEYWKIQHGRILAAINTLPLIRSRIVDMIDREQKK